MKKRMRKRMVVGLLLLCGIFYLYQSWTARDIPDLQVPGELARHYREVAQSYHIPWYYLAAADEVESRYENANRATIEKRASEWKAETGKELPEGQDVQRVIERMYAKEKAQRIIDRAESYQWAAEPLGEAYAFPFTARDHGRVDYEDTWGASRTYGGQRKHEGTDLMAKQGVPVVSVSDGFVLKKGWNRLGGWRLLIIDRDHPQILYYYAHLQTYAGNIRAGSQVKKGQIIGYVGDTGYGPEGTSGKFAPHLHFGIYVRQGWFSLQSKAINPYSLLRAWDR